MNAARIADADGEQETNPLRPRVPEGETLLKKVLFALATAMLVVAVVVPVAFAGGGAQVMSQCPSTGTNPVTGLPGCQFNYFDGNGAMSLYSPAAFHDVTTPSGVENESFQGKTANDTGQVVTYSAYSGAPIPTGSTCYSFASGKTTTDWQMTIQPSGAYSLDCHFAK
jgi:hypothetical protein